MDFIFVDHKATVKSDRERDTSIQMIKEVVKIKANSLTRLSKPLNVKVKPKVATPVMSATVPYCYGKQSTKVIDVACFPDLRKYYCIQCHHNQ